MKVRTNILKNLTFIILLYNSIPLKILADTIKEPIEKDLGNKNLTIDYLKQKPPSDYIIGPGDIIEVIVSREYPELTTISTIDGEGTIYLPRIHRVNVEGLTINELNNLLNIAFKEFVKFPNVEITIKKYRPVGIFVEGEVLEPGPHILTGGSSPFEMNNVSNNASNNNFNSDISLSYESAYFPTVIDGLRAAGGISQFSDLKNIELRRIDNITNGGGYKKTKINLERSLILGDNSQNIRIYDGDIILIPRNSKPNLQLLKSAIFSKINPSEIKDYVQGRVQSPGMVKLPKTASLNDAIAIGGGVKILKGKIQFVRFDVDGTIQKRKIKYKKDAEAGSYSNPYLRDNDLIFVGESAISRSNEVINEISSPFTGLFSIYGLFKAIGN